MIEKLECNCIEAYKTRNMRDPNCCACSCDHNCLVEQLAKANERVKELEWTLSNLDDYLSNKNKFALEQKQEAIEEYKKSDEFCRLLDSHFNSGKVYGHNEHYEQLRKEQDGV